MNRDDAQPLDIAVARDGSSALAIMEYEGSERLARLDGVGLYFGIRLEPKKPLGRVAVVLDGLEYESTRQIVKQQGLQPESLLRNLGIFSIGEFLDSGGHIEFAPSGVHPPKIPSVPWFHPPWESNPPAPTDDAVLSYIASKLYWGWRYELQEVEFGVIDEKRMRIPVREFGRIGMAGEGKYWQRVSGRSNTFAPTARLLQDYGSGVAPGAARPTMLSVVSRLAAPRYEPARLHLEKAIEFLNGSAPDQPNSVKEATAAVESLAVTVLGMNGGTLGDAIKELRGRGLLTPVLAKALEGLWGYASEQPGVRHGKSATPSVNEAEARFALDLSASAINFLLILDGSKT